MVVDKSPLDKSVMSPAREVRVPFPDSERWFLVEEVVVTTPGGWQMIDGLAEDITERKMVEKKIQAAYEREVVPFQTGRGGGIGDDGSQPLRAS
jgi:hypothetical protein